MQYIPKTNISNPLIRTRMCAYQRVRNVSFSENFTCVLNGWPLEEIVIAYSLYLANIYVIKVNNRNTRKRCEICLFLVAIFATSSIIDVLQGPKTASTSNKNILKVSIKNMNNTLSLLKIIRIRIEPFHWRRSGAFTCNFDIVFIFLIEVCSAQVALHYGSTISNLTPL